MIGMMIFDQWWWLMFPGLLLGIYAQIKLSSTYRKYMQIGNSRGLTGAQAAREILDEAGLRQMPVEEVGGHLTDHYDPTKKALFLSSENYHGNSIAAVGVSAHEAGHALQHKAAYAPLKLRMMLVPATQFASTAVYGIFIASFLFGLAKLAWIAVGVFGVITLFQIVTLPVEFDASRRAKEQLLRLGLIDNREGGAVGQVLNAAALTYVAAMIAGAMELLHWFLIARASDRD
jgi:Zn-dependent membrane protease YugP